MPRGKPDTGTAIASAASALRGEPRRAATFIRALYRALWVDVLAISDPAVLRTISIIAGLPGERSGRNAEAARVAAAWVEAWQEEGTGAVPRLVRDDGE